jgi:hypothetical protein
MNSFIHDRLNRYITSETASELRDQILEVNVLCRIQNEEEHRRFETDRKMEEVIRAEFDQLVSDLKKEVSNRKAEFRGIRRTVFERVKKKLDAAKKVELVVDPTRKLTQRDTGEGKFEATRAENEVQRDNIRKLRILRCMDCRACTRAFNKRLTAVQLDRRQAFSVFWNNALMSEEYEASVVKDFEELCAKLNETELETERVRQQLENEKASNIQLVHWKAMNTKRTEELKKKIDAVKHVGDVNVSELLESLEQGHMELDQLRGEEGTFTEEKMRVIDGPLREVESLKSKVQKARVEKVRLMESLRTMERSVEEAKRPMTAVSPDGENARLKRVNVRLKQRIKDLSDAKNRRSADIKSFMENTVQVQGNFGTRSSLRTPGVLIKPLFATRPISRL